MKCHALLMIAALMASSSVGCSKHSDAAVVPNSTAVVPKMTDWGIIEIADRVSSAHTLADGTACTLTPTVLPGGHQILLAISITNLQADGAKQVSSLSTFFTPDLQTIFSFGPTNLITLTLHISK
jgi:hypothetical protein